MKNSSNEPRPQPFQRNDRHIHQLVAINNKIQSICAALDGMEENELSMPIDSPLMGRTMLSALVNYYDSVDNTLSRIKQTIDRLQQAVIELHEIHTE